MKLPFQNAVSKTEQNFSSLLCGFCGRLVPIEIAKTDADGKAIHEECYSLKVKLEQASRDGHSTRPWKAVAEEVTRERDPKRLTELVTELNQALDEQGIDGKPKMTDGKGKPDGK